MRLANEKPWVTMKQKTFGLSYLFTKLFDTSWMKYVVNVWHYDVVYHRLVLNIALNHPHKINSNKKNEYCLVYISTSSLLVMANNGIWSGQTDVFQFYFQEYITQFQRPGLKQDITGLKLMDYINSSGRYTLHYFTPGVWGVGRVMMIFSDLCSYKNAVTFQENLI